MKNKYVYFILSFIVSSFVANAQLLNNTLDNWALDSSTVGIPPLIPTETHTFNDPVDWSTGNQATTNSGLGNGAYVTQDTSIKYEGYSSARLESNAISIVGLGTYVIPGLIVNGKFVINPADFASSGGLDPFAVPGTGSRIVGPKPSKLVGYFKYSPMGSDTMEIIAALVDASRHEVARAYFSYGAATAGFVRFEAPFYYTSCSPVDTLIIIASSSPFSSGVGSGVDGSVLWVDSFGLSTTPPVNVAPITMDDTVSTFKNTSVTSTNLLANDMDCESTTLTLTSVVVSPLHGSTTVSGNNVTYIPALNYVGSDQYTYNVSDAGGMSATAIVRISVLNNVGINEVSTTQIFTYPNPANTILTFSIGDIHSDTYQLCDAAGHVVLNGKVTGADNSIDVSSIANGLYILKILNADQVNGVQKINVLH